jgi:protease-4
VLRINSPGGSASASDKILREAQLLKAAKPLVVSMGSTAASGGYMIALAGQRLFASANTVTGSIGVYSLIPDISGLLQQQGINVSVVETAPFADAPSIFQPLSEQERAKLQSYIDLLYSSFLQHTAQGRNLTLETVQGLAQGRIWSGQRAQAAGLVGELGGLTEAILAAAELAKLDKYSVIEYQKAQGWEEVVANLLQGSKAVEYLQAASTQDLFTRGREALNKQVKELRFYNDPHGIYARLPYSLVIE